MAGVLRKGGTHPVGCVTTLLDASVTTIKHTSTITTKGMTVPSSHTLGAKRTSIGAAVVAVVMLATAGTALADGNGAGDFAGYEIPPEAFMITNQTNMCAQFGDSNEDPEDPLIHVLEMDGFFHGEEGTGTATFTREDPYYLAPEGTYDDPDCEVGDRASLTGDMTIMFEQYDCEGTGTYERRSFSVYTLHFDGFCDDTGTLGDDNIPTDVVFTGTQTPCGQVDCTGYPADTGTLQSGTYVQTH